ncbi:hypothetical protein SPBR_02489 [Sporothrix brasiliensis 5110]|uniref:Uncharacterized protein n=1 Tax=Sporothrix brasiliensis 5110 TaxID=1398154 RepID=A0A0C2J610_9PEZI|nr:uncharacterized protein SPBR_02489 [Sporothrix brasiliensis 5110]KIH92477.1 hypothetical protein SPBR_02489 [Sporothrix brasiliensis 5110]
MTAAATNLLRGLFLIALVLLSGIWATLGRPMAMFDALLAPFSVRHWRRHIQYKVDLYYAKLTKDDLQRQLRSELVADYGNDVLITALRDASKGEGALYRGFMRFAVTDPSTGRREDIMGPHISAADILWRCLCYNARYPFPDVKPRADYPLLDLADWTQAISLLATDAHQSVGRNLEQLSVYGTTKNCVWRRFASLAIRVTSTASTQGANGGITDDVWLPPDELDNVAEIVATLLPVDMPVVGPPLSQIRLDVQRALGWKAPATRSCDFVIPHDDVVRLLCAILRVRKPDVWSERLGSQTGMSFANASGSRYYEAVARSLLFAGGIHGDAPVSFDAFRALSTDTTNAWSLDWEIKLLWRTLFSQLLTDSDCHSDGASLLPLASQAINFLHPLSQTGMDHYLHRQKNLTCVSHGCADVLRALTWPYQPKLVVVCGACSHGPQIGQAAVYVITTSSPLWCTYTTGAVDDFYVDDQHLLFELAPNPRVIQYCSPPKTATFSEIVDVASPDIVSFGQKNGCGLSLNFRTNLVTISYETEGHTQKHGGYNEIPIGPHQTPPDPTRMQKSWTSSAHIERIEPNTASNLTQERVSTAYYPAGLKQSAGRVNAAVSCFARILVECGYEQWASIL